MGRIMMWGTVFDGDDKALLLQQFAEEEEEVGVQEVVQEDRVVEEHIGYVNAGIVAGSTSGGRRASS